MDSDSKQNAENEPEVKKAVSRLNVLPQLGREKIQILNNEEPLPGVSRRGRILHLFFGFRESRLTVEFEYDGVSFCDSDILDRTTRLQKFNLYYPFFKEFGDCQCIKRNIHVDEK